MIRQLAFDLPARQAYRREDFFVSPANATALAAIDGWQGWPEAAPFDAIIVTCAPEEVPAPLIAQLREGGRLCIPVGPAGATQELRLLVKRADGTLERKASHPVRFVPMKRAAP